MDRGNEMGQDGEPSGAAPLRDAARQNAGEARVCEITFAVLRGGKSAVLVTYPDEMSDSLDGPYLDDNCINGYPKEPGFYKAKAVFWFVQGYCDGYPADGESDWGYNLTEIVRIEARSAPEAASAEGSKPPFPTMDLTLRALLCHLDGGPANAPYDEYRALETAIAEWMGQTPSHPSGPSQDSAEVDKSIDLRATIEVKKADAERRASRAVHGPDKELGFREGQVDAYEQVLALLSQSPKGAVGASCPHAWEMEVDGYYRCYLCKERTLDPEEGDGPSAPKTGLRGAGAPGDGDVRALVKAAAAAMEDIEIGDLMQWPKGLALVDALRPFAQPAPGDVGEAGGAA